MGSRTAAVASLLAVLYSAALVPCSAKTTELLGDLKKEVNSLKTSVGSLTSSLDTAKTIADYPGDINDARKCMVTLFPVLTTSLQTIAAIPFPALQTGANTAKTAVTAGKSVFETATSAIPTVAQASSQVATQMTAVKGTVDSFSGALTSFNLIVDRGLQLLEQVVQLLNFGAAMDTVKGKLQSLFETLTTEFPAEATKIVVASITEWMGVTQFQTQLDMIALLADVETVTFDTAPLVAAVSTAARSAMDTSLSTLLTVSDLVANATTKLEAEVKKSVRDIARLFSNLGQGLSSSETATGMMDNLLLRPLDEAVTGMMESMRKQYLAWLDFSDSKKAALEQQLNGVDVAAVFSSLQGSISSKASSLADKIYPTVLGLIKTSVTTMAKEVTNELLTKCAPPADPIACVKEKVEAAMSSTMTSFKTFVQGKMQEHGSQMMSDVISEVETATGVSQANLVSILMSMSGIPQLPGQDDIAALQAQMKVKVDEAVARAQQRADELFESLPLPPGLAALAGLTAPNWKKGLLTVFEATVGNSMMQSLETAIAATVNTAVTTVKATTLAELKSALTSYLTSSLSLSVDAAATKLASLEATALGFWNKMRLDERVIELGLKVKDFVLKWALSKKSELQGAMDGASSFELDTILGGAAGSISNLKRGLATASQPLATATGTLSGMVDSMSSWKSTAESVLTALNGACTPATRLKDALKGITDWLDAEYCLDTVLSSLGCIGGYDVGIVTLPEVCAKDYISRSAYCMVPSQLLQMQLCVKVPDACSCLETALGSDALNICLSTDTVSNLVSTAFNSVISAAGVGNWDLGISFDIPELPSPEFPQMDDLVNLDLELPSFQLPKLLVTSDGTITLQGWMDQGFNIFTQTLETAVDKVTELLKSVVVLEGVADAAGMIDNADFKAALEEGFAKKVGVEPSQVKVALSLAGGGRRLQGSSGTVQAEYTVTVEDSDEKSSDEVQYSMEKVAYDKAGYMTEAKSAMQARSLTNLQSSSVGSVVTSEPEEQVAAPTATTMNEAGRISAAFQAWYPLYLPLGLALL
ncbi:unnamed protein product [Effrenium voratum]|uniref:Uncharacterized protein n=1 Tax=Effrenium voratum TaxID=2562239 RepID=A0AA36MMD2_9DINO|nr:unnamed protein product [Effrenium voratum]